MPVPRKLIQAALETLPEKTLRGAAEHNEIRGRDAMSAPELVDRLARNNVNLVSYSKFLSMAELKKIGGVFGIKALSGTREALQYAVWKFVVDYDQNRKREKSFGQIKSVQDVFALAGKAGFATVLWSWTDSRYGQLGYDKLTPGEQVLWRVRTLLQEINSNSFPGFFENTPDDWPELVMADLKQIGAKKSATALRRIAKKLFPSGMPQQQDDRQRALVIGDNEKAEERFEKALNECHTIWDQTGEDIPTLSVEFAARNPQLFGA